MSERGRILFLFSDTGGGHRSAAEALIEALEQHFPGQCEPLLVDVIKDYLPRPLDMLPESYPYMARVPEAWELGFRLFDNRRRSQAITSAFWPVIKTKVEQLVVEKPADLIVSVHPFLTDPVMKAWGEDRPYFITVVTDLVTGPAIWYHPKVDLTIVPTTAAENRALEMGVAPERLKVIGLPVAERFCQPAGRKEDLRRQLGWPLDIPIVLLIGGAEGMGPLYDTARAIARKQGNYALAVVTGRNQSLRQRLERVDWEVPTIIHGFEREMHKLMQAASLLVTKAGPGTITEGLNAGLPIVLYSRIPGQEDGNVSYVVDQGVGTWAPSPEQSATAVRSWLNSPAKFARAVEQCHAIAKPRAAVEIAQIMMNTLENGKAGRNGNVPLPG
jgi:1,2-diacylglycerol 3-beta-galactosyltransferase